MASVKLISQCLRLILTDIYCRAHNSVSSGRTPLHIIVYTTRVSGVGLQVRRGSDLIVNPGFLREVREPQVEQRQVWVNTNSTDAHRVWISHLCHSATDTTDRFSSLISHWAVSGDAFKCTSDNPRAQLVYGTCSRAFWSDHLRLWLLWRDPCINSIYGQIIFFSKMKIL